MIETINENLKVFRDDLYPFLGGGNKGRKINSIANDIFANNAKALVTTGGIQSNHCRAVAVFAAKHKLKCSLVIHGNREKFFFESGNSKIIRMSGAKLLFVDSPDQISVSMNDEMNNYKENNFNPYYIWGGGHTLAGGKAYIDAIEELDNYCKSNNWYPDYIFHASGTGSTQSGILAGLDKFKFNNTKVIGVSVARNADQATKIVKEFYIQLCDFYQINFSDNQVIVLDEFLCGGYEQYNEELKALVDNAIIDYGFVLDTTYSGKAFYGMNKYLEKNNIKGNVLFWHTGGIFNFLA